MYSVWFNYVNQSGPNNPSPIYPDPVPVNEFRYWGEPAAGIYNSNDDATIGRHAQEMSDLGLDFIFIDLSNNGVLGEPEQRWATESLLRVYDQRYKDGKPFPKVAFLFQSGNGNPDPRRDILTQAYNQFYSDNTYHPNIFFNVDEKPLVLVYEDCNVPNADKFTCKPTWGGSSASNIWSFSNKTPQNVFESNYWSEEMPVSAAQQFGTMTTNDTRGRRFNISTGDNDGYEGQNLQDQWEEVYSKSPTFVLVKAYNEWAAQKFPMTSAACGTAGTIVPTIADGEAGPSNTYCYVDQYNREFSNDIEPMMPCDPGPTCNYSHGDDYFVWMKQYIEKYKSTAANFVLRNATDGKWEFRFGRGSKDTSDKNYSGNFSWAQGSGYQMLSGDFDRAPSNNVYHNDIGLRNKNTGLWHFAFNNGNHGYNNTRNFSWAPGAHYQPLVGDFNDDGYTDIALRDTSNGRWYFAFFDGVNNYQNSRNFDWAAGTHFQPLVGDFNGDGKTDIALRNTSSGRWYFAFFDGVNNYQNSRNFDWAAGSHYQSFSGDFNCDNKLDIGLRDTNTGDIFLTRFNGVNQYYNEHDYKWDAGQNIDISIDQTQCQ